jgi:hypothetical protein
MAEKSYDALAGFDGSRGRVAVATLAQRRLMRTIAAFESTVRSSQVMRSLGLDET